MNKAPPNEEFMRLNDLELYKECDHRREVQNRAAGGFKLAYNDMMAVFHYQQLARDGFDEKFRNECADAAQRYLQDAQDKDYTARLEGYILTTARLLNVLNEMKRRL